MSSVVSFSAPTPDGGSVSITIPEVSAIYTPPPVITPPPAPVLPLPASACVCLKGLHLLPNWKLQGDASVTPNPPSQFGMAAPAGSPPSTLVSITGVAGKYTGGMASKSVALPISPVTGQPTTNALLYIHFTLDADAAVNMQAQEFGAKITDANGLTYNPNFQLDNSKSATETVLEVASANGGWTAPFASIPRLALNVPHDVIALYSWTGGKVSVTNLIVDGVSNLVPSSLQNLAGEKLKWTPSQITSCIQPDVNTKGGSYTVSIGNYDIYCW